MILLRASARKLHDFSLSMTHNSHSPARNSAETQYSNRVGKTHCQGHQDPSKRVPFFLRGTEANSKMVPIKAVPIPRSRTVLPRNTGKNCHFYRHVTILCQTNFLEKCASRESAINSRRNKQNVAKIPSTPCLSHSMI